MTSPVCHGNNPFTLRQTGFKPVVLLHRHWFLRLFDEFLKTQVAAQLYNQPDLEALPDQTLYLLSGLDWLLADLFFDFAPPFPRQPGSQHSVKQICQEKHRWHPLIVQPGEDDNENDHKETRN